MDMIGRVRRIRLRDQFPISEIAKRTGLARNTVNKWLKAPSEVVSRYERSNVEGKLTAFEPTLHQALTTDSHRQKQGRRSRRALFAQLHAQGYCGGYSAVTSYIRRWRVGSVSMPSKAFVPLSFELGEAFQFDYARKLPQELYQSLTWDRGTEMHAHKQFTLATDIQVYFCDPQSPWQRGSNENTNGLLRQYMPKGMNLSGLSQHQLNAIARQLNARPRKTLGFLTPAELFSASCGASTG